MVKLTVGIPAYKAEKHIVDCLASIQIQTFKPEVIIAKDNPDDDYSFLYERFPDMSIRILECEKNTGAGLARQRCLDACETDWITFIDADDVFFSPFALEELVHAGEENVIEVQGIFLQEVTDIPQVRSMPINDVGHPWVFGRCYRTKFLKDRKIEFSDLRAMEDGEFNWKVRMTVEGTELSIKLIDTPIYLWRTGSEHSITRIGEKDGIPQYNYDLCPYGATEGSIRAVEYLRKSNPFNGNILRFTVGQMVGQYFTYIECMARCPIFGEQNLFNAKKFYHKCYKMIESQISEEVLTNVYTESMYNAGQGMVGIIPSITFWDFMEKVRSEEFREEEFAEIRSRLPEDIRENDRKCGVIES